MELIYFDLNKEYKKLDEDLIVALGIFDGLHFVHQLIIKKTIEEAKNNNCKSCLITFDPHPDYILKKRANIGYLTPLSEKIRFVDNLGLDYMIIVNFTLEVSKLIPENFEDKILKKFNIKKIVVGFDYSYGYKGMGDVNSLKKNYEVLQVEEQLYEHHKVGSNSIRNYLLSGDIEKVTHLLGRFYNISGVVEKGSQIGQKIGFRTANIILNDEYQLLKHGVYGVVVNYENNKYLGVCNIGHNPSINFVEKARLEVHILDFKEDIYGKNISIDFVKFLREEKCFSLPEDLVKQINCDVKVVKESMIDLI